MPQSGIWVRVSRRDQDDLPGHAEHASAVPELMQAVGLDVGRQAVIRRDVDTFALYTLTDARTEVSADTVRMGRGGRGRLDGAEEQQLRARLDSVAVDPAATEEEARRGEKLLELFDDGDRRGLIVIAPHGGDIEPFTDHQAEHVRDLLCDLGVGCWRCKGWKPGGGAAARWHVTSTDLSTASFPQLATVAAGGFRHAVSFHGFVDEGRPDIIIGGSARPAQAGDAGGDRRGGRRDRSPGRDRGPDDPLGGAEAANIVNRLTSDRRHGLQIEQQPSARSGTVPDSGTPRWQAIATAVADVYRVVLS